MIKDSTISKSRFYTSLMICSALITVISAMSSCATRRFQLEKSRMQKAYGLEIPFLVNIIMPDTIDLSQKEISIYLEVENLSDKTMNINDLSNWYYAYPQLWLNDSLIDCSVRVNAHAKKTYFVLEGLEKRVFKFDDTFDFVYSLKRLQPGEYKLDFAISPLYDYPHIGTASKPHIIYLR